MTQEAYYSDPSQYGNYQYVTLEQIVNNYMMSIMDSDPTALAERYQVLFHARRGMQELYYDVAKEIKAVEVTLSPTMTAVLPNDFVSLVRMSIVKDDGRLIPIMEDRNMTIAQVYLQDNNYELLFDDDGCVLIGSDTSNQVVDDVESLDIVVHSYQFGTSFAPQADFSNPPDVARYRVKKDEGLIYFPSTMVDMNIVIEYISDGLNLDCGADESKLRIHKFAESAIMSYIFYHLIKNMGARQVPANQKEMARREWYNDRRNAKKRMNALKYEELIQSFKKSNKWIKGV